MAACSRSPGRFPDLSYGRRTSRQAVCARSSGAPRTGLPLTSLRPIPEPAEHFAGRYRHVTHCGCSGLGIGSAGGLSVASQGIEGGSPCLPTRLASHWSPRLAFGSAVARGMVRDTTARLRKGEACRRSATDRKCQIKTGERVKLTTVGERTFLPQLVALSFDGFHVIHVVHGVVPRYLTGDHSSRSGGHNQRLLHNLADLTCALARTRS